MQLKPSPKSNIRHVVVHNKLDSYTIPFSLPLSLSRFFLLRVLHLFFTLFTSLVCVVAIQVNCTGHHNKKKCVQRKHDRLYEFKEVEMEKNDWIETEICAQIKLSLFAHFRCSFHALLGWHFLWMCFYCIANDHLLVIIYCFIVIVQLYITRNFRCMHTTMVLKM